MNQPVSVSITVCVWLCLHIVYDKHSDKVMGVTCYELRKNIKKDAFTQTLFEKITFYTHVTSC